MLFAKIKNGEVVEYPLTRSQLQRHLPHVSLPREVTDEALAPYGYVCVPWVNPPSGAGAVTLGPVVQLDGVWTRTFVPRDAPPG